MIRALILAVALATQASAEPHSSYADTGRWPGSPVVKTLLGGSINLSQQGGPVSATSGTFSGNVVITGTLDVESSLLRVNASQVLARSNALTQFSVGPVGSTWLDIQATGVAVSILLTTSAGTGTAGSGTGVTVNSTSAVRHWVNKVTVDKTAMTAAATTDITIWTTPVNTRLIWLTADVTQVFTGGALTAVTLTCGSAAGGNQYLLSGSVFTATTTLGDVVAEQGAGLVSATAAPFGTPAAGIPGAIAISCRFTCTTANCNAATTGSVAFQIEGVSYP